MRSFFTANWPSEVGVLHFYALPSAETVDRVLPLIPAASPGLSPVAPAWLHFTIARFSRLDDLTRDEFHQLARALDITTAGVDSFELELGKAAIEPGSIVIPASPSSAWDDLVSRLSSSLAEAFDSPIAETPTRAHLSVAYATDELQDESIAESLSQVELGPCWVERIHLVSVTRRAAQGSFDWTELANWSLGKSPR